MKKLQPKNDRATYSTCVDICDVRQRFKMSCRQCSHQKICDIIKKRYNVDKPNKLIDNYQFEGDLDNGNY